jgi:acetyl esterase/lipase
MITRYTSIIFLFTCCAVTVADDMQRLTALPADAPLVNYYQEQQLPEPGSDEASIARSVAAAMPTASAFQQRLLATLRVRIDYHLHHGTVRSIDLTRWRTQLAAIIKDGVDPFGDDAGADETSNHLRGYYAATDDSCQPFTAYPPTNDAEQPAAGYPLVVSLHGHGWDDWYEPFMMDGYAIRDAYVASPQGRGSADFKWIAEDDTIAVIDAMLIDYPIDPTRVYLTGGSMGATGTFQIASHYPDRFAAGFADSGNSDITAWSDYEAEDPRNPRSGVRTALRSFTSPIVYAENLHNIPLVITHCRTDATVPHSQNLVDRLEQAGCPVAAFRLRGGRHVDLQPLGERFKALRKHRLNRWPRRVRLTATSYRHAAAYWVSIERFQRRLESAYIDITRTDSSTLTVNAARNVARLRLRFGGLQLDIHESVAVRFPNGDSLTTRIPPFGYITIARVGGTWHLAKPSHDFLKLSLPKRRGLEGPIADVFREPFLLVTGTTAKDPFERWIIHQEVQRFQRQWRRRFQVVPPAKDDTAVSNADVADRCLVLFGGPRQNAITARLNDHLPVSIDGDAVVVGDQRLFGDGIGMQLVYPNPENPDRAVVVLAGVDWRGIWQISHRFGSWFDWMPLDNYRWYDFCVFDDRSRGFESFLDVGIFDEGWRFSKAQRFAAVEGLRDTISPRRYPTIRNPSPEQKTVKLSELWPAQIDTAKDSVRVDRSWNDMPLMINDQAMSFGLGQWIESAVSYNLLGDFRRFRASIGIDPEGATEINDARTFAENPSFIVAGDNKILAQIDDVRFGEAPRQFDVDVTGIQRLTLMVVRGWPAGWHYGAVAWGEPVLER